VVVAYLVITLVVAVLMFACVALALLRADRADIPAVVEALGRWWRR
jgi:hypothetical protein